MNSKLRIIGLAGTNGSGKDTVGQILADQHGYLFVSVTDLLRAELENHGMLVTRKNMRTLGNEWRRERGLGVLVDKAVQDYEAVKDQYKGLVIASLRNPGEADRIHELSGSIIWIDADPRLRYERVQANATSRGRAGEDNKTFEQFLAEEQAEMNKPTGGDDATLSLSAVKAKADNFLNNEKDQSKLAEALKNLISGKPDNP